MSTDQTPADISSESVPTPDSEAQESQEQVVDQVSESTQVEQQEQSTGAGGEDESPGGSFSSFVQGMNEFDGLDDEQIAGQLVDGYRQRSLYEAQARQNEQLAQLATQFIQGDLQPPAPVADTSADTASEPEQPWWNEHFKPAAFNPNWQHFLVKDEEGNEQFGPNTPAEVQQAYVQHMVQQRETLQKIASNPYEFMAPVIEEAVRRARDQAKEELSVEMNQRTEAGYIQNLEHQHKDWLYMKDSNGNFVPDPSGQGAAPSALGQRMHQLIAIVSAPPEQGGYGITDPRARWNAAYQQLSREVQDAQQQRAYQQSQEQDGGGGQEAEEQSPMDQAVGKKVKLLKKNRNLASKEGNRAGTETPPGRNAPSTSSSRQGFGNVANRVRDTLAAELSTLTN
jgi:LysM repeat protein